MRRRRACSPPGGRSGVPPEEAEVRGSGPGVRSHAHRTAVAGGSNDVDAIVARAVSMGRLGAEDLLSLFEAASLHQLGAAAHAVRCKLNPGETVTYIVDRNINYTNVCVYRCRFCAFYRKPWTRTPTCSPSRWSRRRSRRRSPPAAPASCFRAGSPPTCASRSTRGCSVSSRRASRPSTCKRSRRPRSTSSPRRRRCPSPRSSPGCRTPAWSRSRAAVRRSSRTRPAGGSGRGPRPRPRSGWTCTSRRTVWGCAPRRP